MKTILVTPKAREDLDHIWSYTLSEWGLRQAEIYVNQLWAALQNEAKGLSRAQDASYVRDGYFKLVAGAHVVFFQSTSASLTVVRILDQRMDVERHLIE